MWRSFFVALGLAACALGGEFLAINKATLKLPGNQPVPQQTLLSSVQESLSTRDFVPPEWAPWTLLSVGAVIVLYSSSFAKD